MAIIRKRIEVSGFDEIRLEGTGIIALEQGPQDGLEVETDEELLPKLKTEVVGGRLELGVKHWYDQLIRFSYPPVHYYISMQQVKGVGISGSGELHAGRIESSQLHVSVSGTGAININDLQAGDLKTTFSGSGKAQISGRAQREEIGISGSGEYMAENLDCQEADVHVSGMATLRLAVSQKLDVHISGSGQVEYKGQPRITPHISGSGKITPI